MLTCIITRLLRAAGHECGQFCHFELRKWCDALLILRQASGTYYLCSESCPACCSSSSRLLPRSSAFNAYTVRFTASIYGLCYRKFQNIYLKPYEMCSFLWNNDIGVTASCKYHGQGSCNAELQSGGLRSQKSVLLCPTSVAYPGILFGGGVQQIQLRTEDRENGGLGAVAL